MSVSQLCRGRGDCEDGMNKTYLISLLFEVKARDLEIALKKLEPNMRTNKDKKYLGSKYNGAVKK